MKLYDLLASEYTELFPSSAEKALYTEKLISEIDAHDILDLGCASGEFALQLATEGRSIIAIDPDTHMIQKAQELLQASKKKGVSFLTSDMLSLLGSTSPSSEDAILCMGNTIVYLNGEEELKTFLTSARSVLRKNGAVLLQLLNYENPAIVPGFTFPELTSTSLVFSRSYKTGRNSSDLAFTTQVTEKDSGETHTEVHRHSRFTSTMIRQHAEAAGFTRVTVHGGYSGEPSKATDFFRLITLRP